MSRAILETTTSLLMGETVSVLSGCSRDTKDDFESTGGSEAHVGGWWVPVAGGPRGDVRPAPGSPAGVRTRPNRFWVLTGEASDSEDDEDQEARCSGAELEQGSPGSPERGVVTLGDFLQAACCTARGRAGRRQGFAPGGRTREQRLQIHGVEWWRMAAAGSKALQPVAQPVGVPRELGSEARGGSGGGGAGGGGGSAHHRRRAAVAVVGPKRCHCGGRGARGPWPTTGGCDGPRTWLTGAGGPRPRQ